MIYVYASKVLQAVVRTRRPPPKKFQCPKCQVNVINLNRHLMNVHKQEGGYRKEEPGVVMDRKRTSKVTLIS